MVTGICEEMDEETYKMRVCVYTHAHTCTYNYMFLFLILRSGFTSLFISSTFQNLPEPFFPSRESCSSLLCFYLFLALTFPLPITASQIFTIERLVEGSLPMAPDTPDWSWNLPPSYTAAFTPTPTLIYSCLIWGRLYESSDLSLLTFKLELKIIPCTEDVMRIQCNKCQISGT